VLVHVVYLCSQGVLSEMEEQSRQLRQEVESQVGVLKEELERKDSQIQDLTCTLTSIREHLAEVEASGQAAARRIGRRRGRKGRERLTVCIESLFGRSEKRTALAFG